MVDILVTDDDSEMRAMLCASLGSAGYAVEVAASAAELFAKLAGYRGGDLPEFLICDVRMPDGDGLQILEQVRAEYPSIQVILITAFGDELLHWRAAAMGAVAVFDKPFSLDRLRELLAGLSLPDGQPA